jgi:WD40 repeat protein
VRVPDNAVTGVAIMTLSIVGWKDHPVEPITIRVPVVRPDIKPSPELIMVLRGHPDAVYGLAYSPDGSLLATGSGDGAVKVWNSRTGQERATLQAPIRACGLIGGVRGLAFTPDGRMLAANWYDFTTVPNSDIVASVAGEIRRWDVKSNRPLPSLRVDAGHAPYRFALSPDGRTLAVAEHEIKSDASGRPIMSLFDWQGSKRLATLPFAAAFTFSPDSKMLATAAKTLSLWDARTGTLLRSTEKPLDYCRAVSFAPNGTSLATGDSAGRVRIYNPATLAVERILSFGSDDAVQALLYSPDSKILAIAAGKRSFPDFSPGRIFLWDQKSDKPNGELVGHWYGISQVAFAPGGNILASCGLDKTVRLGMSHPGVISQGLKKANHRRSAATPPNDARERPSLTAASACGERSRPLTAFANPGYESPPLPES